MTLNEALKLASGVLRDCLNGRNDIGVIYIVCRSFIIKLLLSIFMLVGKIVAGKKLLV